MSSTTWVDLFKTLGDIYSICRDNMYAHSFINSVKKRSIEGSRVYLQAGPCYSNKHKGELHDSSASKHERNVRLSINAPS